MLDPRLLHPDQRFQQHAATPGRSWP
jgi:hypothetical protein